MPDPAAREQVSAIIVTDPVDGRARRRPKRAYSQTKHARVSRVHPAVMAAAAAVRRPGERIVIISEREVVLR